MKSSIFEYIKIENLENKIFANLHFLIIAIFYIIVSTSIVNIPQNDDHLYHLKFTNEFISQNTISEKWNLLFAQTLEHRVLLYKTTALISYYLLGKVNYYFCILLGNLFLLGIFRILILKVNHIKMDKIMKTIIALLVFIPIYKVNDWAITANGMIPVIFFALATFNQLEKRNCTGILNAILFCGLAMFTFANGLLVPIIGAIIIFMQKRYKILAVWLSITSVFFLCYFNNLIALFIKPSIFNAICYQSKLLFTFPIIYLASPFKYIFNNNLTILFLLGLFITTAICYIVYSQKKCLNKNSTLFGFILFIILTAGMTSYGRGTVSGIELAIASRYEIFSSLLLPTIIILIHNINPNFRRNTRTILIFTLFFSLCRLSYQVPLMHQNKKNLVDGIQTLHFENDYSNLVSSHTLKTKKWLNEAQNKGVYFYSNQAEKNLHRIKLESISEQSVINFSDSLNSKITYQNNKFDISIQGHQFITNTSFTNSSNYLIFQDELSKYFSYYIKPVIKKKLDRKYNLNVSHSFVNIDLKKYQLDLASGNYKVYLGTKKENKILLSKVLFKTQIAQHK